MTRSQRNSSLSLSPSHSALCTVAVIAIVAAATVGTALENRSTAPDRLPWLSASSAKGLPTTLTAASSAHALSFDTTAMALKDSKHSARKLVARPKAPHVIHPPQIQVQVQVSAPSVVAPVRLVSGLESWVTAAVGSVTGPTSWLSLNAVIASLPKTLSAPIVWTAPASASHWGTTSFEKRSIEISQTVPLDKLYSVAVHEWSHMKSTDVWAGDVPTAFDRLRAVFGGTSSDGVEISADCMARVLGATWTNYTACDNQAWRAAAAKVLNGERV